MDYLEVTNRMLMSFLLVSPMICAGLALTGSTMLTSKGYKKAPVSSQTVLHTTEVASTKETSASNLKGAYTITCWSMVSVFFFVFACLVRSLLL